MTDPGPGKREPVLFELLLSGDKGGSGSLSSRLVPLVDPSFVHRDHSRRTLLHAACAGGCDWAVPLLVSRWPGALEARDDDDKSPVHLAIESGHARAAGEAAEAMLSVMERRSRECAGLAREVRALRDGKKTTAASSSAAAAAATGASSNGVGTGASTSAAAASASSAGGTDTPRGKRSAGAGAGAGAGPSSSSGPSGPTTDPLPSDSKLLQPRVIPASSRQGRKRLEALDRIRRDARRAFEAEVTPNAFRQIRLLDDPPHPVYRLIDAMCFIVRTSPPRTWPECQTLLRQGSFREALRSADMMGYTVPQMQQLKQCAARLDDLLAKEKLPPAVYAVARWVNIFEKGTSYLLAHPVEE